MSAVYVGIRSKIKPGNILEMSDCVYRVYSRLLRRASSRVDGVYSGRRRLPSTAVYPVDGTPLSARTATGILQPIRGLGRVRTTYAQDQVSPIYSMIGVNLHGNLSQGAASRDL